MKFDQILSSVFGFAASTDPTYRRVSSELGAQLSASSEILGAGKFAGYDFRWSAFHRPDPSVIVVAISEEDVGKTLKYVSETKSGPFFVQNGGHGWDIGLEKIQKGVFLSLARFQNIEFDATNSTVTAGAGVGTETLVQAIHKVKKQLPVTSCFCPSQIGPTLGGGAGRFMGLYGMMLDNLLSARVALANGTIVTASDDTNSDLLWALRGAGANFGVVLEATYRLHDQPPDGLIYNLDMIFPGEKIPEVFEVANSRGLSKESSVALIYAAIPDETSEYQTIFMVSFVHVGPAEDGWKAASPYLELSPAVLDKSSYPYDIFARNVAQKAVNSMCAPGRGNMFSVGVKSYDIDTVKHIYNTTKALYASPDARASYVLFQSYSDHAVKSIPSEATAYAHREVNHNILAVGRNQLVETDDAVSAWGTDLRARSTEKSGFERPHVHLNYARGDESLEQKYGEPWRIQKLKDLKAIYDPGNLFNAFHPIIADGGADGHTEL